VYDTGARERFDFEFAGDVRSHGLTPGLPLDPSLPLTSGRHFPANGVQFGMLEDASPDRWGRQLMDRQFARLQRARGEPRRKLRDSEYLLGVRDALRPGAIRLRPRGQDAFEATGEGVAAPPLKRLRELEAASRSFESDSGDFGAQSDEELRLLLAPGASLGGARPKACVSDAAGTLLMAKFPSIHDEHDVGTWEWLLQGLAARCGIRVPRSSRRKFVGPHHTFLVERFDRTEAAQRVHFASAMTLTAHRDGEDASTGVSYLEIAEVIARFGCEVDLDLRELWTRVVFNMLTSNTDDHLRNHGFLLEAARGWRLSPAYDMNPNPAGRELRLNVTESDNACHLELALEVAPAFRLSLKEAREIVARCTGVVASWRDEAKAAGASRAECDRLADAFRLAREGNR